MATERADVCCVRVARSSKTKPSDMQNLFCFFCGFVSWGELGDSVMESSRLTREKWSCFKDFRPTYLPPGVPIEIAAL